MKKCFSLLIVLLFCVVFINSSEVKIKANLSNNNEILISESPMYSYENVNNFKSYLIELGYDLYNIEDVSKIAKNFKKIYTNALNKGVINKINNDILLVKDNGFNINNMEVIQDTNDNILGITPMWNAGKSLEHENDGTHQVITRDALTVVTPMFPNFFEKNSKGNYITQTYSDYPDIEETTHFNSWHFYNYETKDNYWGNILDSNTAKSKFFEHYNNAKAYYNTNPTIAFRELGATIHYISDIATPVHVGDGIRPSDWWVELLMIVSPVTAAALYLTDMVSDHTSFENYVNQRDEYSYCDIPSYIDYDYYTNINLNTLIDNIASNSFEYYEQARGNNSQKYVAMVNTLPYAKEVVAGLLYRFADEMYESHTHKYTSIWTGQNYHSGDRHYYQSVEECTICGHYGSYEWISYFCPGPPCLGVLSNEK